MKKQILEALKNKYKNLGLGEKAFEGVADFLSTSITEESQIETAIAGVEGLLKAFQADADKLRTEKSAAEKKLAELVAKATGNEPTPEIDPKSNDDDTPAWAKSLIESNKTLSDKLAALEGEKVTSTRKGQLTKLIEKLPAELQKPYNRMAIDKLTDEEFATLTSEITTEVEGISNTIAVKGAVFGRPAGGGATGATTDTKPADKEVEAVAKAMGL